MKLGAGYPMGPFELLDYVGLDTVKFILDGRNWTSLLSFCNAVEVVSFDCELQCLFTTVTSDLPEFFPTNLKIQVKRWQEKEKCACQHLLTG